MIKAPDRSSFATAVSAVRPQDLAPTAVYKVRVIWRVYSKETRTSKSRQVLLSQNSTETTRHRLKSSRYLLADLLQLSEDPYRRFEIPAMEPNFSIQFYILNKICITHMTQSVLVILDIHCNFGILYLWLVCTKYSTTTSENE